MFRSIPKRLQHSMRQSILPILGPPFNLTGHMLAPPLYYAFQLCLLDQKLGIMKTISRGELTFAYEGPSQSLYLTSGSWPGMGTANTAPCDWNAKGFGCLKGSIGVLPGVGPSFETFIRVSVSDLWDGMTDIALDNAASGTSGAR